MRKLLIIIVLGFIFLTIPLLAQEKPKEAKAKQDSVAIVNAKKAEIMAEFNEMLKRKQELVLNKYEYEKELKLINQELLQLEQTIDLYKQRYKLIVK